MGAYKDKNGTWFASARYKNWAGETKRKMKRGFSTKREALAWERQFIAKNDGNLEMTFESFYELYKNNLQNRLRENTWYTKEMIIKKKILPYFGNYRICDIKPIDVLRWQNTMIDFKDENGMPYSPMYLKTIHNQLSAVFNHAVRFYGLSENPAAIAGNMGKEKAGEVLIWTKEEYQQFSNAIKDRPVSFIAFEILYWCGLRLGELLALTPSDFDFKHKIVSITKSYQRIGGEDIITPPKTDKSIRRVLLSDFLSEEIQQYLFGLKDIAEDERIFPFTKSFLHHEMQRGCTVSGVKKIKIHGIRHSHISLLIDMGCNAVAIADRVGHESIDITYRYAHVFPSTQQEVASKLDNMVTI
ncbi:site-specific integrase [Neobittarella massiliensis]|uniref:site-specific integrase n=1 Tax=Neobittarella massiliensis (ex Bilen et al. 2018) TaxID=2041842 RepID=UPI000CF5E1C3|nr:site-specific integrase [Neobittarella massiliensis]